MKIEPTAIPDVKILRPVRHGDERGFLSETWNRRTLREACIDLEFVQDNHAVSREKGVVRGLHFQVPPHAQDKLILVLRGAIYDVAVDIRRGSPHFGRHVAVRLDAADGGQLLVPAGFAHGYCTLEADTEVFYKVTAHYAPEHDKGILWNDPALGIPWPVGEEEAILSPRDRNLPPLADLAGYFDFAAK